MGFFKYRAINYNYDKVYNFNYKTTGSISANNRALLNK